MSYKFKIDDKCIIFLTARTSYFSPMIKQLLYPSRAVLRNVSLSSWQPKVKHNKMKIKLLTINHDEIHVGVAKHAYFINVQVDLVFQN